MSTRQLKKLHKQQELARIQNLAQDEDSSSEEEISPPKPRASAFAGFAALQGDDDENDEQESDNDQAIQEPEAQPEPAAPVPAKKSKKSKKKKKGKQAATASPANDATEKPKSDGLDEIDLALKELNMKPASQTAADQDTVTSYDTQLARLLSIRFHHLKIINELRAMFGQDTIESVRRQDEAQARDDRRRNRAGRHQNQGVDLETFLKGRHGEKISDVVLRNNPFIQGVESWPKATAGGLKMDTLTDARVDPTEYTFSHDPQYQVQEMEFAALVDMMDPMRIVHFVHQHPYHVNSLIQTSRFAHHQDHNAALARDLCERALFTFGRVTLSSFRKKLERGVARLDFRRPENRQFWLAGYHYIQSLSRQGTYETALEWAKLYLSLSLQDEYAMMNFVHVLAIQAHEAQWFLAFCKSSYFTTDEYDVPMKDYYKQTCVLAKIQLEDTKGALEDLVKGMETLPWLYSAICSAVNIDTPRSIWGVQPRDEQDTLYTELYIHMAKDLWKRYATDLLKEAGEKAQKVDAHSLPRSRDIPLSIGRFIYLDNTPELMRLVPSSMLHASPNFDYDPLPPPFEENIFSSELQSLPWRPANETRGANNGRDTDMDPDAPRDLLEQLARMEEERIGDAPADNQALMYTLARRFLPIRWLWGGPTPPDDEEEIGTESLDEEEVDEEGVSEEGANEERGAAVDEADDGSEDDNYEDAHEHQETGSAP